jgi:hypothetical protein
MTCLRTGSSKKGGAQGSTSPSLSFCSYFLNHAGRRGHGMGTFFSIQTTHGKPLHLYGTARFPKLSPALIQRSRNLHSKFKATSLRSFNAKRISGQPPIPPCVHQVNKGLLGGKLPVYGFAIHDFENEAKRPASGATQRFAFLERFHCAVVNGPAVGPPPLGPHLRQWRLQAVARSNPPGEAGTCPTARILSRRDDRATLGMAHQIGPAQRRKLG